MLQPPARPIPNCKLAQQMLPLVSQLATADLRAAVLAAIVGDLALIETIAAGPSLVQYPRQITVQSPDRIASRQKPLQLRMVPVTTGPPQQHCTCQQSFTPERNQPARIEQPRMQ